MSAVFGSAEEFYRALAAGQFGFLVAQCAPVAPIPVQGHFSTVLLKALERLDAGDPRVLPHFAHHTGEFATFIDGFPKSKVHLLALPRQRIMSARELKQDHLPMLRRLAAYIAWLQQSLEQLHPDLTWRHGIHAEPSLKQLHVHIISQDFKSPCMKHRKHYNSFQPPFLVGIDSLINAVEKVDLSLLGLERAERYLQSDMCCAGCGANFQNRFAELKKHLNNCNAPPSAPPPSSWRALEVEQETIKNHNKRLAGSSCDANVQAKRSCAGEIIDLD